MGQKVFASAIGFTAITPSDSTLVTCKAIYVGVGGNIAIAPSLVGAAVTFLNVGSGVFLPVELKDGRVMSTNTTATNLINIKW